MFYLCTTCVLHMSCVCPIYVLYMFYNVLHMYDIGTTYVLHMYYIMIKKQHLSKYKIILIYTM